MRGASTPPPPESLEAGAVPAKSGRPVSPTASRNHGGVSFGRRAQPAGMQPTLRSCAEPTQACDFCHASRNRVSATSERTYPLASIGKNDVGGSPRRGGAPINRPRHAFCSDPPNVARAADPSEWHTRRATQLVRMTLRASDGSRERREANGGRGRSRDRCAWARIPGQGVADIRAVHRCAWVCICVRGASSRQGEAYARRLTCSMAGEAPRNRSGFVRRGAHPRRVGESISWTIRGRAVACSSA
jgi:hypothetical protein